VHESLKSSCQCIEAVKSATKTLGMISRTFMYKNNVTLLQLYKSLVRPKLEYCIQAWLPYQLENDYVRFIALCLFFLHVKFYAYRC